MATNSTPLNKSLLFFILSVLILAAVIIFRLLPSKEIPSELQAVMRAQPVQLTPFELTDQSGNPFTLSQLKGKTTLLFFGYMSCPDICPTTLSTLNQMVKKLDAYANADLQVVFVSVDPNRDRPEKMAEYLNYFNPNFIGLGGDKEAIDNFTRQFAAGYMLGEKQADGNYLVSHTSSIFMIDPQARLIATFSPPHKVDTLVSQYKQIKNL